TVTPSSSVTVPDNQTVFATIPTQFTVSGTVMEEGNAGFVVSPNASVQISAVSAAASTTTTTAGAFTLTVPGSLAQYQVVAAKGGFISAATTVTVAGNTAGIVLQLVKASSQATISGVVGGPPRNVAVTVTAVNIATGATVSASRGDTGP